MELVTFLHIIIESGFAMLCILAAIYIHLYDRGKSRVERVMICGLIINAVINIMDSLAYFYHGDTTTVGFFMVRISNFAVFAGVFVLLAFGNKLLDSILEEKGAGHDKTLRNIAYCLSAAGVVIISVLSPFGLIYNFDEQNVYHRGRLFVIVLLIVVPVIAAVLLRIIKERSSLMKAEFRGLMLFYLLPAAGAMAQVLHYGISLSNIANSISMLIMAAVIFRRIISEVSIRRSFILSGEGIDRVSADVNRFLEETGTERQNRIRIRLTVEEALLNIWHRFGELNMVKVTTGVKLGRPSIRIDHEGEPFNPFSKTKVVREDWSSGLLASAGISPAYSYRHGINTIKINLSRMSVNPVITVFIAIMFGIISGWVAKGALSESDALFLHYELLTPVYDLWNNILYSVSAPAMFIIVMSTMLDTREVSEQGGNAGVITGRYFVISLAVGAFTVLSAVVITGRHMHFNIFSRYAAADLLKKLFSIIPENMLDPFKEFNTAQLILMGIIFAYAVMAVGQQAGGIVSLIHQLNMVSMQLAQWIATLMPGFMVFLTAQLVLGNNTQLLFSILKVVPFAVAVSILTMAMALLYISHKAQVSPALLLKKLWPSFALTLRTGQVAGSYALAEKTCIKDFGIQKIFTQRVLPLGLVLYMPSSMVGMVSFVIYAAFRSGITITPVWTLTVIVFALILLVAAPPIPGVNLLSYIVIMGQLGIGKEYVLVAMIFDIVFDLFGSAANQMMLQLDMILQARQVGLINFDVLRKGSGAQGAR